MNLPWGLNHLDHQGQRVVWVTLLVLKIIILGFANFYEKFQLIYPLESSFLSTVDMPQNHIPARVCQGENSVIQEGERADFCLVSTFILMIFFVFWNCTCLLAHIKQLITDTCIDSLWYYIFNSFTHTHTLTHLHVCCDTEQFEFHKRTLFMADIVDLSFTI